MDDSEEWKAASRRLVVVSRVYTADPICPHVSEAAYVWKNIKEEQLNHLLERLVQLLLPSAIDQIGLKGVVHEGLWRIAVEVSPILVDYANPTSPTMTARGVTTEGVFGGMVELMSTRKTVYGPSASGLLNPKGGPSHRLPSVGGESMASVRQMFRQARPDIAALLSKTPGGGAGVERLAAIGDVGDRGDQQDRESLESAFHNPHASYNRG